MSSNYPPPQQSGGQNQFGQQQQYAAPQGQSPYGAPQGSGGFPPPAATGRDNMGLGIAAGIAATLVGALLYGALIKGTEREIGYAALAVGALIGLALGKVGGRNPVLPFVGIPLSLLAVYAGKLFGMALIMASAADVGVVEVFTDHFSVLQDAWKESMDAKDILFFLAAGAAGFAIAKRVAD